MSANSSNPEKTSSGNKASNRRSVAIKAIGLLAWVLVSFIGAQLIVIFGWMALSAIIPGLPTVDSTTGQFILTALIYLFTLLIVISGSVLIKQRVSRAELGVNKPVTWLDIGLAPATFVGYMIVSSIAILIISQLVPGIDLQQAQDIGFDDIASRADTIMAFLALVVFAPIAEEVLFRGYLYGKLRTITGAVVSSILASALFGAVHGQWNVAIDTFILSMAMCGLREITGSIWAGTFLHMIKNGLAFFLIFVYPTLGF